MLWGLSYNLEGLKYKFRLLLLGNCTLKRALTVLQNPELMDLCHSIITHNPLPQLHLLCGPFALRIEGNLLYSKKGAMLMKPSFIPEHLHFSFSHYSTPFTIHPSSSRHEVLSLQGHFIFSLPSDVRFHAHTHPDRHTQARTSSAIFVKSKKSNLV